VEIAKNSVVGVLQRGLQPVGFEFAMAVETERLKPVLLLRLYDWREDLPRTRSLGHRFRRGFL
jgi:hypothetical protein